MPDAPPPRYNSQGRPLGDWLIVVRYDSVRDALTVSWNQDATMWRKRAQGAQGWPGDDVEEVPEAVRRLVVMLHQPRLF